MLLLGYSVHPLRLPALVLSLLLIVAEFPPILLVFLGRALFEDGDSDTCWSGAGMLKTASTFVFVTSEKLAHLLLLALLIILLALVENSKPVSLSLP